MRGWRLSLRVTLGALAVGLVVEASTRAAVLRPLAEAPTQQQAPVFRSDVEIIRLDVSVLDRVRRPIRGLTAGDFTVLENGRPQRIVAVTELATDRDDPAPSAWMRHVPQDVAVNDLSDLAGDGRILAVVMDDWNVPFDDIDIIMGARDVGRYVIDRLGANDVAAVVFPLQAGHTVDFTTDRRKLLEAIDRFDPPAVRWVARTPENPGPGGIGFMERFTPMTRTNCERSQPMVPTLEAVIGRLSAVPNRRKTIVLVSVGIGLNPVDRRGCAGELTALMNETFRRAQQANVNVYPIDPAGLGGYERYLGTPVRRGGRPANRAMTARAAAQTAERHRDFLRVTAEHTGGRAVVNTDSLGIEIDRMFQEASAYYLVGYQSEHRETDGRFRRLEVKVGRPGAIVRTRSGYYAPTGDLVRDAAAAGSNGDAARNMALSGMAPGARLALRAHVVAVDRSPDGDDLADVAITLGVRLPASRVSSAETLTVSRTFYDAEGRAGAPHVEQVPIVAPPGSADELRYEVHQRARLAPGRWEARLHAGSQAVDTSGTVYVEFEVPDLARSPVSLSGILLGGAAGSDRTDRLAPIVPIVPTTAREFSPVAGVRAFARVFQGGSGAPQPVSVTARLLTSEDVVFFEARSTLPAAVFAAAGSAPFEMPLNLANLPRGPYLLTLTAGLPSGAQARSDVVFRVR